jgi:hypothetical protein
VIHYKDGAARHEAVLENGRRLKLIQQWGDRGVGLGFMGFGVEVIADQARGEFKRWIGGYYENIFSGNPIWEPTFIEFPEHPIARGVLPFQIKNESTSTYGSSKTFHVTR